MKKLLFSFIFTLFVSFSIYAQQYTSGSVSIDFKDAFGSQVNSDVAALYTFDNPGSSLMGLDYDEVRGGFWLACEDGNTYLVNPTDGTVIQTITLTGITISPYREQNGVDVLPNGNLIYTDFIGDNGVTINDYIFEINPDTETLVNYWPVAGDLNTSTDGSNIIQIIDIAYGYNGNYFVTSSANNIIYEIALTPGSPGTWETIATHVAPTTINVLGIDFVNNNFVLSDFNTQTIVYTDIYFNEIGQITAEHSGNTFNTGVCFYGNDNPAKIATCDYSTNSVGVFQSTFPTPPGNSLHFDGTDNVQMTLPSLFNDLGSNSFSVEAWINSSSSDFCRVWFAQSTTSNFATLTLYASNQVCFHVYSNGENYSVLSNNALTGNTFVSCTFNASTHEALIYFDGVIQTTTSDYVSSSTSTNNTMTLGAKNNLSQPYVGEIDEFRIWDYVISNCQISELMDNELEINTSGLVTYYNFNQGSGGADNTGITTLIDCSGNGNDGTLNTFSLTGTTSNWLVSTADISAFSGTPPTPDVAVLSNIEDNCSVNISTYNPTATNVCGETIIGTTPQTIFDTQGTYTIIWTYSGLFGTSTQEQTIIIDDVTAPVTPTLSDITGECDATATTPTTTDNCTGTITGTTSDDLFYDMQGTYIITWNFDDGNGNSIDVEQNVIVEDITNPTVTCVNNQLIELLQGQSSYTVIAAEFDATGDDNCNLASITNDYNDLSTLDGESLIAGTHTITWTVTDDAGNTEMCYTEIIVSPYVGINNINAINVTVYPNPTSGILTIENAEGFNITITDVNGRTIYTQPATRNSQLAIDISNHANGMYFIQFTDNNTVSTIKIIKKQ